MRRVGMKREKSRVFGLIVVAWFLWIVMAAGQRPRVVPPNEGEAAEPAARAELSPEPDRETVGGNAVGGAADPEDADPEDPDSGRLIAVLEAQNEAIRHRLVNRLTAGGSWRPEAMPSGAAGMELFSESDHESGTYVRNPDLWAQDLTRYLTGAVIHNTHSVESYGGVLITPRHLLFCAHAHPHAAGTWRVNPERGGAIHRFVTEDGRLVKSKQLHQARNFGRTRDPEMDVVDLCVALLDRDLEAEGLHVAAIFPPFSREARRAATDWSRETGEPFAFFGVSQGVGRRTNSKPPEPVGDYPREHSRMLYIKERAGTDEFAEWDYRLWDGDSGTPAFLLLNGEPHLWMIITVASGNGPAPGEHIDHIQTLIEMADENAVAEDRLESPMGLRVRVGEW